MFRKEIKLIVLIWVVTQVVYYFFFGIRLGGDSGRYIEAAEKIIKGIPLNTEQIHYLTYEWMLVPIFSLGGGYRAVVIVQCFLSLAGALCIYWIGSKKFSRGVGMTASIIYLANPSIQRWNFYILTENLATTALIGTIGLAIFSRETTLGKWILFPAAIILVFTRPETLFFLIPVSFYLFDNFFSWSTLTGAFMIVIAGTLFLLRPGTPDSFGIIQHWLKGTYIWGYPGIGSPEVNFDMNKVSAIGNLILHFLWTDPWWVVKVLFLRILYFLVPIRPFYSKIHNIFALGVSLIAYCLAFYGTIRIRWREGVLIWLVFLVQMVLAALTWSDWDNRWLDRVMPLLTILIAVGGVCFFKPQMFHAAPYKDTGLGIKTAI